MKRDMDLARRILLEVEKVPDPMRPIDLAIEGYESVDVSYHVQLLHEAGLLVATDFTSNSGYKWSPRRLTWAGHEFLDAARDDTLWNKVKAQVKDKLASVSFDMLKALLVKAAADYLGSPG